jgi:hypothetical protein
LENETKPWPIFDRTYKRENQLLKKAVERESSDDDDSVDSNGDDDFPLAPPAPTTFSYGREEKIYEVELGEVVSSPRASSPKKTVASLLKGDFPEESAEKIVADDHFVSEGYFPNGKVGGSRKSEPQSSIDARSVNVQESGIPTAESPKKTSSPIMPTISLVQPTSTIESKPPQSARPKEKGEAKLDIIPRSIPRTICYSLRSAIGDGSVRQRNSHTLMEQRPLRPNGCAIDVSYWSHRGKRSYMEGE